MSGSREARTVPELRTILVINPNSNRGVTRALEAELGNRYGGSGPRLEFTTLADGPFGIESDADVSTVAPLVAAEIERRGDCAAYVIACYSDPGLDLSRQRISKPVFGMQQSAVAAAIGCGGRFGVLALSEDSIARHLAYLERLGLVEHLAGELPLDMSVDEAASAPDALPRLVDCGRRLIAEHGAHVLVFGCAGLARHRLALQQALGVTVIEPVRAAVALAAATLD